MKTEKKEPERPELGKPTFGIPTFGMVTRRKVLVGSSPLSSAAWSGPVHCCPLQAQGNNAQQQRLMESGLRWAMFIEFFY